MKAELVMVVEAPAVLLPDDVRAAASFAGIPCTQIIPCTRSTSAPHCANLRRRPRRQTEKMAVVKIFPW